MIITRVERIKTLVAEHGGVQGRALSSTAHPATAAVIPGATRPSRIAEDIAALSESVPVAFWAALRDEKLIAAHAPTA
ncbi:aldo/keto reductase [Streptomyces hirsutus]